MRDLRYGIEIEMTGLSRGKAAETLAGFFGTRAEHTGGSYDAYAVRDAQDRVWKLVSDGSVPFPVSWTVKMKKKQKETQDILSYHTQAAGCSDKARAKASGGRQPIEECGRTGL